MEKSNLFGFLSEYCGEDFPTLTDQPKDVLSDSESALIAAYLDNCPVWVASPGIVYSSFDGWVAGSASVKIDGEWAWEDTMAYYVRKYRIGPTFEFIQHIQKNLIFRLPKMRLMLHGLIFLNNRFQVAVSGSMGGCWRRFC
jgi:hypothetical protein